MEDKNVYEIDENGRKVIVSQNNQDPTHGPGAVGSIDKNEYDENDKNGRKVIVSHMNDDQDPTHGPGVE